MSTPAAPIPVSPWMKPDSVPKGSPWGALAAAPDAPCSLQEVMSEQLATELEAKTVITQSYEPSHVATGCDIDLSEFIADDMDEEEQKQHLLAQITGREDGITEQVLESLGGESPREIEASDFLMAQMLQHEFDVEHDDLLRREEAKLNGSSKVSLNFTNYRNVHPTEIEDSDSEQEEDYLWEERPTKDPTPQFKRGTGICGKGKNIITKHDSTICGRKNTTKVMDRFPPEFETGDAQAMDMKLPNNVYNKLKRHSEATDKRKNRLHEKKEHATAEMAVDQKTRLILYKLVNAEILELVSGVVSSGKESVVFHAKGGGLTTDLVPTECAIKVFKTTLNEFKNRIDYVRGDKRFLKDEFKKQNPRRIIKMWAQKEEQNLRRLEASGIPCPHVVTLKKHVLVMSFLGSAQQAAPKLKEARLNTVDMQIAYEQSIEIIKKMYNEARLVHADLSEYNLLWHDSQVHVIDVSQAVEKHHPHAFEFLLRDCENITQFFRRNGVPNVPNKFQLFNEVTGLNLEADGDDGLFLKKLQDYERNEEKLRMEKGKEYPFDYFFDMAQKERETELSKRLASSSSDSGSEYEDAREELSAPGTPVKKSPGKKKSVQTKQNLSAKSAGTKDQRNSGSESSQSKSGKPKHKEK